MKQSDLTGLRVLVAEDQMLVAMEIEAMLADSGCLVVGPVGRLDAAVRHAREDELDAALLDVNLDGETIFPAVRELQARAIPFILATGYGQATLPEDLRGTPTLEKPFREGEMQRLLGKVCGR